MLRKQIIDKPEGSHLSMDCESEWWALVGGAVGVFDVYTLLGVVPWENVAFAALNAH